MLDEEQHIVICGYRKDRTDGFFPRIFSSVAYWIARFSYTALVNAEFFPEASRRA
jgi:hypothetical protein